jgi:Cytochrome c7 and related cytochrome c/Class III cytochrome C family
MNFAFKCAPVLGLTALFLGVVPQVARSQGADTKNPVAQPIEFSHKKHAAQGLDCDFCHSNVEPGEKMSIPDAPLCMECHQTVASDKPSIKKLSQFATSKKPVPWIPVYSLPAFVFWSHRTHLSAKQPCEACHGKVGDMEAVQKTNVTTMDGCVDCHDQKNASTGCRTCHESRTS